jgi:predicted acetyltransferase
MTDFTVRPVSEGEQRACHAVLAQALHVPLPPDERWDAIQASFPAERKFAAFAGQAPVGIVTSFATDLLVPGGKLVSTAAVDGVGVRADWTRRGVLTAMMAEQLPDFARRGHVLAGLHASETTIYGRFGYGPSTYGKTVRLAKPQARWAPEVPAAGQVRFLSAEESITRVPEIYRSIGLHRPGMIARPDVWWPSGHDRRVIADGLRVAVHTGPDGDDGFATIRTVVRNSFEEPELGVALEIRELHAATPDAVAGLWRFLLGVDLVSEVRARFRPMDEPLAGMLADSRACQVRSVEDELWVRLIDVEAALNARTYFEADPVVLDVRDSRLPENSGHYLVGPDGAKRTDAAAQARLDVNALAMMYLGEWPASALAQTGRIEVFEQSALARLDELFRTPTKPWCGTHF